MIKDSNKMTLFTTVEKISGVERQVKKIDTKSSMHVEYKP